MNYSPHKGKAVLEFFIPTALNGSTVTRCLILGRIFLAVGLGRGVVEQMLSLFMSLKWHQSLTF